MSLRRILNLVGPIVCTVCLAAGHAVNGAGIVMAAGASSGLAWWLANKRPADLPPTAALLISIVWGAAGLQTGAPSLLMILGTTFALASWDLALFDQALTDSPLASAQTIALFQTRHYGRLALTLGLGLLMALIGQTIHLQISLVGIGLLALLALFCLDRIWRTLRE